MCWAFIMKTKNNVYTHLLTKVKNIVQALYVHLEMSEWVIASERLQSEQHLVVQKTGSLPIPWWVDPQNTMYWSIGQYERFYEGSLKLDISLLA